MDGPGRLVERVRWLIGYGRSGGKRSSIKRLWLRQLRTEDTVVCLMEVKVPKVVEVPKGSGHRPVRHGWLRRRNAVQVERPWSPWTRGLWGTQRTF